MNAVARVCLYPAALYASAPPHFSSLGSRAAKHSAQVRAVQEYVRELLEQEEKFLIFAHHQVLLDGIQEVINKCASRLAASCSLCVKTVAHAFQHHAAILLLT